MPPESIGVPGPESQDAAMTGFCAETFLPMDVFASIETKRPA